MKIVVFIKPVPDNSKLSFPESGPDLSQAVWMMNPYDEYGLEAALQIKEQTQGELTVISCGNQKELLKKAVALGADQVYQLIPSDNVDTAEYLTAAVKTLVPDVTVIITGQISLDTAFGQTGPGMAARLNWPWLGRVKAVKAAGNQLQITQELPEGLRTLGFNGPIVLSFIKGNDELRTPNIKGVMKANKADVPEKSPSDFGLDQATPARGVRQVSWLPRIARQGGRIIQDASAEEAAKAFVTYLATEHLR